LLRGGGRDGISWWLEAFGSGWNDYKEAEVSVGFLMFLAFSMKVYRIV